MFCDLVDFTVLAEALDPEELRALMDAYHHTVAAAVLVEEGYVAKLLGDGVLAYFGWPQAHENDAERAVRAGLAVVRAVKSITAAGRPIVARVGIATGPVVVGDISGGMASERGAVAGATPNLAARLQADAAPGEIVIRGGTRRLLGSAFSLEELGQRRLKGFTQPVAVWRVGGIARRKSRFDAFHGEAMTGFVGHQYERALLDDRWRRASASERQVVLLGGEAGIGKSRVLHEFATRREPEKCSVLRYQCSPHEVNAAFAPVISELETTAELLPDDPPERRLDRLEGYLEELLGRNEEAAMLVAALLGLPTDRYPPVEMAPQRRRQRTIAFLIERIAALSRTRPILMLLEDAHWIDPSSLEFLDALLPRLAELPVLLVVTHRTELLPRWSGHGHVTFHSLGKLDRDERRLIASRTAGGKALPDELLEHIVAQTDGVPLFVEELTKAVLETGILEERAERYVLSGPLPELELPPTLQDSLMARLDRLAPVKRVIQAAACIGREFDPGLLAAALPMAASELEVALGQLVAAQLIFQREGGEGRRYIFRHALVQDAAYSSLLKRARAPLHARIARALEVRGDADSTALARHHFASGAHERAAQLYLAAARSLLAASAAAEAAGALERALDAVRLLPPSTERDRLELQLRTCLGTARTFQFGWQHP